MISLILLILASIMNACMDTLKDHFTVSVFRNLNEDFWNPAVSWKRKTFLTYRLDAWHIFKSIAIICVCFAVVLYEPVMKLWLADVALYGLAWDFCFEVFYSKILRRKK